MCKYPFVLTTAIFCWSVGAFPGRAADSSSVQPSPWSAAPSIPYSITDLGTLGGTNSTGYGINNLGQVVGRSDTTNGETHAFLYSAPSMNDLGTLGGRYSIATDINNNSQIVGAAHISKGSTEQHGFLYRDGKMIDLGEHYGYAAGINDSNQIVGTSASLTQTHAFLYSGGVGVDLFPLNSGIWHGNGINNKGQVVGTIRQLKNGVTSSFVGFLYNPWEPSLQTFDGYPNRINNFGRIAGRMDGSRFASDINDAGETVGTFTDSDGSNHAMLFSAGIDLNSYNPFPGWTLTEATAINETGQIVANGVGQRGQVHAFLLTHGPVAKPIILAQPQDAAVNPGSDVPFAVTATGVPPIRYQWFFDGAPISSATNKLYLVHNAQTPAEGVYWVAVNTWSGSLTSAPAILSVNSAPTITVQPNSQSVTEGGSVTFEVGASGTAPLRYQWQFNGSEIRGATGSSLSLSNLWSGNAGKYSVMVRNVTGWAASDVATLKVFGIAPWPTIVAGPVSQTANLGADVAFNVSATGTSPLSYRWQHEGHDVPSGSSSSLMLTNVQPADAGRYWVSVTNSLGSAMSATAILTVVSPQAAMANRVLVFDGSPQSQVVVQSAPDLQSPSQMTVEAWFEPVSAAPGIYAAVISKEDGLNATSQRSYELRWFPDGRLYAIFYFAGSTYASTSAPLPINRWTHLAASFTSTEGAVRLYTNGVLAATTVRTDDARHSLTGLKVRQTSLPLIFGQLDPFPNTALQGSLDEVRVWSVCRSGSDIASSWGCRVSGSEPGLAGYWNFEGGDLSDATGHGHSGAPVGEVRVLPLTGDDVIHAACGPLKVAASITSDKQVQMTFVPVSGRTYLIQVSADLKLWSVLTTVTNTDKTVTYREPLTPAASLNFYRVLER